MSNTLHVQAIGLLALVSGCSAVLWRDPLDVPEKLRPPAHQTLAVEANAAGVQIYQCSLTSQQPSRLEWVFKGPEAELTDSVGRHLGKHYAGPTWESIDGSTVVGAVVAHDAGPDPQAIPWLLLRATANTGPGVFGPVTSIQRLRTVGGSRPAIPCTQDNAKAVARVPYTALYRFHAPAPEPTLRGAASD